jgi:hypothetical protein
MTRLANKVNLILVLCQIFAALILHGCTRELSLPVPESPPRYWVQGSQEAARVIRMLPFGAALPDSEAYVKDARLRIFHKGQVYEAEHLRESLYGFPFMPVEGGDSMRMEIVLGPDSASALTRCPDTPLLILSNPRRLQPMVYGFDLEIRQAQPGEVGYWIDSDLVGLGRYAYIAPSEAPVIRLILTWNLREEPLVYSSLPLRAQVGLQVYDRQGFENALRFYDAAEAQDNFLYQQPVSALVPLGEGPFLGSISCAMSLPRRLVQASLSDWLTLRLLDAQGQPVDTSGRGLRYTIVLEQAAPAAPGPDLVEQEAGDGGWASYKLDYVIPGEDYWVRVSRSVPSPTGGWISRGLLHEYAGQRLRIPSAPDTLDLRLYE